LRMLGGEEVEERMAGAVAQIGLAMAAQDVRNFQANAVRPSRDPRPALVSFAAIPAA
jgi:hypothetical protein